MRSRRVRVRLVMAVLLALGPAGLVGADESTSTRSTVFFWSVAGISQEGPEDQTFHGLRFLYLALCDDMMCHTPFAFYGGGEVLTAEEGTIARALGSFTIFCFPFGPRLKAMTDQPRFDLWLRPTVSIDALWDTPDEGVGVSAGFGAEFAVHTSPSTQVTFGWERYFSSVLGSRNQLSLSFRWGVREKPSSSPPEAP